MEKSKYVTLSMEHLNPITRSFLELYVNGELKEREIPKWMDDLGIYEKKSPRSGESYGYFVYITFPLTSNMKSYYPSDIFDCINFAVGANEADFIIFDSDEPPIGDLPTYDDNTYLNACKLAFKLAKQQLHKTLNSHGDDRAPLSEVFREYEAWLEEMIESPNF